MILISRFALSIAALLLASVTYSSSLSVEITQQALTGGGYLIVKTSAGSQVSFLEQTVIADQDGYAAVGLGRNITGIQRITVSDPQGEQFVQDVSIASRAYREQRIEGINPAQVNPPADVLDRIFIESKQVNEARAFLSDLTFWRSEQFIVPVEGRITGVYGSQRFYNGEPRSPHWGIDYAAPTGSPVKAPASGVIRLAENDLYYSGGTVVLDHGGGLTSSFLHLSELLVSVGDEVRQGDVIAKVGSTGRSTGPHLDWRMNLNGERIDAALWLQD